MGLVFGNPVINGGGGGGSSCNLLNPSVSISPSSQSVYRGDTASYTVTATNNDDSCAHTFDLSVSCPSGISCSLSQSSITVSAGSSASVTLSVSTTNVGSFSLSVSASDSADGLSGSASATLVVDCDPTLMPSCDDVCTEAELRVNGQAVCTDNGWVCQYDSFPCTSSSYCNVVSCGGLSYECRSVGWLAFGCDGQDGWYDTGASECRAPAGSCVGTIYKEQEYRDYYCSTTTGSCGYTVTGTRWVDTGQSCNLPAGTVCQSLVQPCPDGGRSWCSVINGNDNVLVYIPAEAQRVWRCDANANCVLSEDYCADVYNVVEDCDDRDGTYTVPGGTQVRDYFCVEDCTQYNCAACEYVVVGGTETDCGDGVDNDGDGLTDCLDTLDCAGKPGPNGVTCCASDADCSGYGPNNLKLVCDCPDSTQCSYPGPLDDYTCKELPSCRANDECAPGYCCDADQSLPSGARGSGTCKVEGTVVGYSGVSYLCDAVYGWSALGPTNVSVAEPSGFVLDFRGLARFVYWPLALLG